MAVESETSWTPTAGAAAAAPGTHAWKLKSATPAMAKTPTIATNARRRYGIAPRPREERRCMSGHPRRSAARSYDDGQNRRRAHNAAASNALAYVSQRSDFPAPSPAAIARAPTSGALKGRRLWSSVGPRRRSAEVACRAAHPSTRTPGAFDRAVMVESILSGVGPKWGQAGRHGPTRGGLRRHCGSTNRIESDTERHVASRIGITKMVFKTVVGLRCSPGWVRLPRTPANNVVPTGSATLRCACAAEPFS